MTAGFNLHSVTQISIASVTQLSLLEPAEHRKRNTAKPEVGFPEAIANSA
jgi:hypothetical protein